MGTSSGLYADTWGYDKLTDTHHTLAVVHLIKQLMNHQLKNCMLITAQLKSDEDFRSNFKAVMRELASEAKIIDRILAARK